VPRQLGLRCAPDHHGRRSASGISSFRTGLPINALSDAFLASFASEDPAIFTGSRSNLNSLKSHVDNVQGTVYNFAGGATGAATAYSYFRGPLGLEYGSRNLLHGPSATNLDMGLAKIFPIIPSRNVNLTFRADTFLRTSWSVIIVISEKPSIAKFHFWSVAGHHRCAK